MGIYFHQHARADTPFPLARHVLHDDLSRDFDAATVVAGEPIRTVMHERMCTAWDQGSTGSCTAHAALGVLMTAPFHLDGWCFGEDDATRLYKLETRIDNRQIPGVFPPDDTGSTGLWSMKALKRMGLIKGYRWAFSIHTATQMVMRGPVSVGISWYNSMFEPDDGALHVDPHSGVAGGHQVEVSGYDTDRAAFWVWNSWGTGWGINGGAWLSRDALAYLLQQRGDVVAPVV